MANIQMIFAASVLILVCIVSAYQTHALHTTIGTRFYLYTNAFVVCIILWAMSSLVMGVLTGQEYYDTVIESQYIFRPWGYLAIGLMISAMESVKSKERSMLTNVGFLFSGGLIVGTFSPPSISLSWTSLGWVIDYSLEFNFGRLVLFSTVIVSALPLGVRLYQKLRNFFLRDFSIKVLFWSTIIFTSAILVLQPILSIFPSFPIIVGHPAMLILDIALFVVLASFLFQKHPTILFVETQEISELYIIKQDSGLPLYHFKFRTGKTNGSEILSAFFTGIKQFVKHSLGKGDIESVLVGNQEMLIHEGMYTYGILIARQSSELTRNLLKLSVESFEKYNRSTQREYIEVNRVREFDSIIERYFEFAIIE